MSGDGDEKGFLTAKQLATCGCFDGAPSSEELERFFLLDDEDRKLIAKRCVRRAGEYQVGASAGDLSG